jgi:hypothetical protein
LAAAICSAEYFDAGGAAAGDSDAPDGTASDPSDVCGSLETGGSLVGPFDTGAAGGAGGGAGWHPIENATSNKQAKTSDLVMAWSMSRK